SQYWNSRQEIQNRRTFKRVIDVLADHARARQHSQIVQAFCDNTYDGPGLIEQRSSRVARLHRYADLKITLIIPSPSQAIDISFGEFRFKTLNVRFWKAERKNRTAELDLPAVNE